MNKNDYYFKYPLIQGLILDRPNRFIMNVLVNGDVKFCHCPSTGKIDSIIFKNIPCLLSKEEGFPKTRKTEYTVEAISLNNPNDVKKYWIGINQGKTNNYMENFFKTNQLKEIVTYNGNMMREKMVANSRIDFIVENNFIEVKTPLTALFFDKKYTTNKNIERLKESPYILKNRFMKHVVDLGNYSINNGRTIFIIVFMFDAGKSPEYDREVDKKDIGEIRRIIQNSMENGMELWQVNFIMNEYCIKLKDYFRVYRP